MLSWCPQTAISSDLEDPERILAALLMELEFL